eukprot:COSAG03_NODE_429_length_7977_cov_3.949606_13_plen_136_part_00
MRPVHAPQRPVTPNQHATQLVQTVLVTAERVDLQLPAVGRQRGGYSHQMSPGGSQTGKIPPSSAKKGEPPCFEEHSQASPHRLFYRNRLPSLRSLPGSVAANQAAHHSAPTSAMTRRGRTNRRQPSRAPADSAAL